MNPVDLQTTLTEDRRLTAIRHGWLGGCELYLANHERFPLRSGFYERELKHRFESMMTGTELFLDIGAGEGFFSSCLLRRTEARVVAYEADEGRADLLRRNVAHNVTPNSTRWHFAGSHREEGGVVTLDHALPGNPGAVFLKIEAEGEEDALLSGAGNLLDRDDTRVLIRLSGRRHQAVCMRRLDEHGFSVELVAPAWWRPFVPDRFHQEEACWLVAEKAPFQMLLS